jgi:hypothetical protein
MVIHYRYCASIVLAIYFLKMGLSNIQDQTGEPVKEIIARLSFGSITSSNIVYWSRNLKPSGMGIIANSLVANSAQTIVSFLYFTYNGLFTCMAAGAEYSSYGRKRKGLRVSQSPQGNQRTTYFLQLPYRFAIPLMILSALLHWLVSQSIFVVFIRYPPTSFFDDEVQSIMTCGWSPAAILCVTILAGVLVSILIWAGFQKLESNIPLAGSCSAAISAACQQTDIFAGDKMLKWGVTWMKEDGIQGHCSFSADEVMKPDEDCLYS